MATLQQVIEAFDSYVEGSSGLGITCIKGFPDFRQPEISAPIAAIFYSGSQGGEALPKRIGASSTAVSLTLAIYARHEVELFELAEKLHGMRTARIALTAGSGGSARTVRVLIGEDERLAPAEDDPKELRHYVSCGVVLGYE